MPNMLAAGDSKVLTKETWRVGNFTIGHMVRGQLAAEEQMKLKERCHVQPH